MKKTMISLIAFMASLSMVSPLFASGYESEQSSGMEKTRMMSQSQIPSADKLMGMTVINMDGTKIGKIEKVNTDPATGQVNYVTLSKGGVLGMGKDIIAAPLAAFNFDMKGQQAQLTVDQSKLDNVPQRAGMDDKSYEQKLESHYGVAPAWEGQQNEEMMQPGEMETDPQMEMERR